MSIGADSRLSNTKHVSLLPASWGSLYELTKLDDGQWALAEGASALRQQRKAPRVAEIRRGPIPREDANAERRKHCSD